ncbi:hypothetical protein DFQ14_12024 [Halopolyspora algeriensis]|uniref:Permease n=1 Tax=Halopolyspora algeriensis TaxID=1500506 RepID=A0A368VBX9_9ACTN|nr:permease [Halopolyspora algeriensis]RCW38777.1 hypothetical protein DFQ14_12024 [Halopolyspora algeriensis]TQM55726.1 hypothetical protein FHU43_0502 [Halopolyspora algeriensis]
MYSSVEPSRVQVRSGTVVRVAIFLVVTAIGLTWAKWWPYATRIRDLWAQRQPASTSVLDSAGAAGSAPSWRAGWDFTVTYMAAVWPALVVALVVAALLDALVARRRLPVLFGNRSRLAGSLTGGVLSLPSMMCTCCTAPLVATLRRQGVQRSALLAYWVGNPTLNPAVLAFLLLIAPWQWFATRLVVGMVLVFWFSALVARLFAPATGHSEAVSAPPPGPTPGPGTPKEVARGFLTRLATLSLLLVPEYFAVVFVLGALRGWLFPLDQGALGWGPLIVVIAAVAGTLVVIPTAGEIPILLGLVTVGAGAGTIGALLITLPAVSAASVVMLGRALSWRVAWAMAGAVAVSGLLGAGFLTALT